MANRTLKTKEKVVAMREGGRLLAHIRRKTVAAIRPGITLKELNKLAEKLILKSGGKPSFKMVPGYDFATCINLNEGIVHGIPGESKIKDSDLVTIDIGFYYQGFHTDAATTIIAGKAKQKDRIFLETGKRALKKAIKKAKARNRVADISRTIQYTVESAGFFCANSLTGHGIGANLHQDPPIPCLVTGVRGESPELRAGQTLAIEVIYAEGSPQLYLEKDGWTLKTKDGKNTAVFEETILVTEKEPIILTKEK